MTSPELNRNPRVKLEQEQLFDSRINCGNCTGACCRAGTILELTEPEHETLEEAGTELIKMRDPVYKKRFFGRQVLDRPAAYLMKSDCAMLDEDRKCMLIDSERRPRICGAVLVGGWTCTTAQEIRIIAGKDLSIGPPADSK